MIDTFTVKGYDGYGDKNLIIYWIGYVYVLGHSQ